MPLKCPNCSNQKFWMLHERALWFTVFFIPVIPHRKEHWVLCPVCDKGYKITGTDNATKWKALSAKTEQFLAGQMTEEAYVKLLDAPERPLLE